MSATNSNPCTVQLPDLQATTALAGGLAKALPDKVGGWMILLAGELGAGKSTFARGLLHAMGHDGAVPSPTYTLVEPYKVRGRRIYHVDLYRISDVEELEFLGWSDLQDGLLMVEWPERAAHLEADADMIIHLQYDGHGRSASIDVRSDRAAKLDWPADCRSAQG